MRWTYVDEVLESHDDMSTDEFKQLYKQPSLIKLTVMRKEGNNERRNDSLWTDIKSSGLSNLLMKKRKNND